MNNLRKIFCAVLVFAILCSALAFAISAETTGFTPSRTLDSGNVPGNTKSEAEGNLYYDFSTWGAQDAYKNTLQTYIVYENGSDDGYYLARVESEGKDVPYVPGSDSHNHINLYMRGEPVLTSGDVIVYESDMYFESDVISNFGLGLNITVNAGNIRNRQDYDLGAKLPTGEWFRFTLIADFDTNMGYYYVNGKLIGTADKFVTGELDPETTIFTFKTLRWQFYQATVKHGQSLAFDNVYTNIYKNDNLGTYTVGAENLEGFDKATEYNLREVLPIATIDGVPYYTASAIKSKLSTSLKPVVMEILRDSNAALSITCDATIKTNGIDILIDTPEGAEVSEVDEDGYIEVDVAYTPAYTIESDGFGSSFVVNNGDKSINILKGNYGSVSYYASDAKLTPYAGGDSYAKVTPVKDASIGKNEEVRVYYTDRYYMQMDDYYVVDFDVATESEFADMVLIPVLAHETVDSKVKTRLDGTPIRFEDFLTPSNEWAHITVIGDIANNKMYLFVNDVLVNDNYGIAYDRELADANGMDLTESFENSYSSGPLNFVELRVGFKGTESVINTTETTLLKNIAVRRFAATEGEAITTALENATLSNWANNKNTTKGEKLPSIIVVDGEGYGNVGLANKAIAEETEEAKEISFRADFSTVVKITGAAILETNGVGQYIIEGADNGPVYFEDEDGFPAMITSSTSISEKDGKIYISQVTIENALETCQVVYWAYTEDFEEYVTIYYPAGSEISYVQHPDAPAITEGYTEDGVNYVFAGWVDMDGSYVEDFGFAKAETDSAYYPAYEEQEITATLTGVMYNLSLYTNYAINLFVPADIYVGEATETAKVGDVVYAVLTKEVAATEIAKNVEFVVTFTEAGKEFTETVIVSVIEYAEAVMASNYSDMLKKTIMAALNYSETAIEELVDENGSDAIKAILGNSAYAQYLPAGMTETTNTETTVSTYVFDATAELPAMGENTKADGETTIIGTNGYFTIHHSAKNKVDGSNKSFADGYTATQRLNMGGKTEVKSTSIKNAIEFTTNGPATLTIWWVCGGDGREIDLYDANGSIINTTAESCIKNSLYISTFDIAAAGKYYIGSSVGSNYYFKVQVTETGATEAPETPATEFLSGAFLHIDATPDFVFVAEDSFVGTITFTYTGVDGVVTVTKEVNASENAYVVLDDVKIYDMTATITITAEGTINGTTEYSLATYIAGSDCKTAEALYVYSTIAKAYKLACNKVVAG